ncbi:MAG: hypothetical protein KC503_02485 [Myxococcales bacterium]|nr:hypothetical protein [Myxococcales bacterium]
MSQRARHALAGVCLIALAAAVAACGGTATVGNTDDGGLKCEASKVSGLWLVDFGPLRQEISGSGEVTLSVVVVTGSAKEGEGAPAEGKSVNFKIINAQPGVSLSTSDAVTGADGIASVKFTVAAGTPQANYQVQASIDGTCPKTFTIDVRPALRQLRAITPTPFDTFTGSRVPVAVEASTNGNAKLAGEEITFKLTLGKTGETKLSTIDGQVGGDTLKVTTGADGRATAMVFTGDAPIPQLEITATLTGTADAIVQLRIAQGTGSGCKDVTECPLGYNCKSGVCEPPITTPPSGCQTDNDCQPPLICQKTSGQCLEGTGKPCDPIEGTGCAAEEICVGGQCAKIPGACQDHTDCPSTFKCTGGKCVPQGQPPTGGCVVPNDCPNNQTCINGNCKPKSACNVQHAADRLKGTWQYDSKLKLREALGGFVKGLLGAAGVLRDIIEGRFSIKGIPSFISSIVSKYVKQLINQYIPPWGQQLIVALGDINDIIDDMRILSTVQKTPTGADSYICAERWQLIEFDFKGQKISAPPSAIPQIGEVKLGNYPATEVCGELFIAKHKVQNKVGGIIKWAIETALSIATCNIGSGPCFNSVEQALTQVIQCQQLGIQLDQLVQSLWSGAPSVASIVAQACESQKTNLIKTLNSELNNLTTKLSLLELSGTVVIPAPGADNKLDNGKWDGTLGSGILKGNFSGTFNAVRQ